MGRVVSIGGWSGGPGTKDPGRYTANGTSIFNLILRAYGVRSYQIMGPDWLKTGRFDVVAKVPEGATKEQFALMLQNLLAERFKLAVHKEQKELPVYELVVAKNGPKLKEWVDDPAAPKDGAPPADPSVPRKRELDADGYPILRTSKGTSGMSMTSGLATERMAGFGMELFASGLAARVGRPVTDRTGLTGTYDIVLHYVMEGSMGPVNVTPGPGGAGSVLPTSGGEGGPTMIEAIQSQLGLKLESKKGMVEILVVDHAEKVPTEN